MAASPVIEQARDAYRERAWRDAYERFAEADRAIPLEPEDLERLARSADLLGREDDFFDAMERAHGAWLESDEPLRAARAAFWIGMQLAERGRVGPASGWLGRARRLVEAEGGDSVEAGYLLVAEGYRQFSGGHPGPARDAAARAVEIGRRFDDRDLSTLALHLQGRALVRDADIEGGLALLDEAMVAVASDELSPHVTGLVYCSVISACRDVWALARAREWTAALAGWCERQHDLVAYTDQCRVHRAELMQLRGDWRGSIEEARRAAPANDPGSRRAAAAAALYQEAEAHRLLGDLGAAEEAYRAASRLGREPQPGLALLRLVQGDGAAAAASIRRALAETSDRLRRARLLPACVEIMLATGQADEAERACEELEETARRVASEYLAATAAHARGVVELSRGDASDACVSLREACSAWRALEAPYQAARAREALAEACAEQGDADTAALEREAARDAYAELGAAPDLERLEGRPRPRSHGLTPRELEVLALVATGKTNRAIGGELFISEKTVARHVANIFSKLGLSSRAAATAYAYEHDLLRPTG